MSVGSSKYDIREESYDLRVSEAVNITSERRVMNYECRKQ